MRIACAAFLLLTSCGADGISWGPVTYRDYEESARPAPVETETLPSRGGAGCAEIAMVARGEARYAAWWEARAGGSSVLMLARSSDGGAHWEAPIVADDRDRGGLGCGRPLPSLFADDVTEYLHVTYHIAPAGGAGVYFTHSMHASELGRSSNGVLHTPVPVAHGEGPARSAVAGHGDTVVVAFEDPNAGNKTRILLSYSTGAGHVFGTYEAVSQPGRMFGAPRVSLTGDTVRVEWTEQAGGVLRAASRIGRLP
jgi:hypothetical protein